MRNLYRNKKAVSTVISTILMIMVVMVGMSVLFAYIVTYTVRFQSGRGSQVLEAMTVEDVQFTGSNNVNIWIYNTGKIDFTVNNVYIDGAMASVSPTNMLIHQGKDLEISVAPPSGISFETGGGYSFKIITARGSAFEGTYLW